MSNNEKRQKIAEWLFFVEADLQAASIMLEEKVYHIVCFHAQQAVEKVIKALLLLQRDEPPKQHLLMRLAEMTPDKIILRKFKKELAFLDQFYIPTRYPDAFPGSLPEGLPNKDDASKALKYARDTVWFVKGKLEE